MDIQKISPRGLQQASNQLLEQAFRKEPFDSHIFKMGVGKVFWKSQYQVISEQDIETWAQSTDVKVLFSYVSFEDLGSFKPEERGHTLISSKIVYELKKNIAHSNGFLCSENFIYEPKNQHFRSMITDLSITSHYAKDSLIGNQKAFDLYAVWIKNSFEGYAEKIFVALEGSIPTGFISLKNKSDGLYIDLIAVHQDYRGKGIARGLLNKTMLYAQQKSAALFVCTQVENVVANRLYQDSGFLTKSVELVYHKHVKK